MSGMRTVSSTRRTLMVGDIAVQVERKAVKNISIRVRRDGTVHASVPRWMSDAEADAFVLSRRTWIEAHAAGSPAASGTLPWAGACRYMVPMAVLLPVMCR